MSTDFLTEMESRGLLQQVTDPGIAELLAGGEVSGYIGFDPTADSLHVGSLFPLLTLVRFQRAGHQPIAVLGGGTGLVGDPSGKESERPMLSREALDANLAGIRSQVERFLDFSGPRGALLLDNSEWLGALGLLGFLRDIGKHFSVNALVARDSVRRRLESREQGISYTEFTYALLQAYDFLEVYDRHGCRLQMGGSDQWGNIVSGCDLIRRLRGATCYGLTFPLVTRADGRKFGKSEEGNVWLSPRRTSPYQFYQFWLNVDDSDVMGYLRGFTFAAPHELEELERELALRPEERQAQRRLARDVTAMVHGDAALTRAEHATAVLFAGGDLAELSAAELAEAFAHCPASKLPAATLDGPEASLAAMLATSGLAPSRAQARQAIAAGGVYVNDRRENDAARLLRREDILAGRYIILRRGKKSYHVLELEPA